MKATTRTCLSWLSMIAGTCIILGGCFISIALRNPGGPPVPVKDANQAIQFAYIACAVGAFIAIAIPVALTWSGHIHSSKKVTNVSQKSK